MEYRNEEYKKIKFAQNEMCYKHANISLNFRTSKKFLL